MRRHQRLEQTAVVRHAQVKQFVGNDEILEAVRFIEKIGGERDRTRARTRTPFARHPLDADTAGIHSKLDRPSGDALFESVMVGKILRHDQSFAQHVRHDQINDAGAGIFWKADQRPI